METIPRLLLITNRHQMQPSFEDALEAAWRGGARLVQLREKDLNAREVVQLAQQAQQLCAHYGAQLLLNSCADIAAAVGAAGVHLPEHGLSPSTVRAVIGPQALVGSSVHSVEAARRAEQAGADYLVFGSVFPTGSHPDEAPQGLEKLRFVASAVRCPVFAIGGIDATNAHACLNVGAHGIAVISAVWSTPDVTASVQTLLRVLDD